MKSNLFRNLERKFEFFKEHLNYNTCNAHCRWGLRQAGAKLVPIGERNVTDATNELFGIWKDNAQSEDVDNYVINLRKGRFDAN